MKTRNAFILSFGLAAILLLNACASMTGISGETRSELVRDARIALNELYRTTPEAAALQKRSTAILVFPDILKAGLIVGGSGGNGVMFSPKGEVLGYYNASAVSYGLQAGAQSYSETMFLMTSHALEYLESSAGWSIGAGPSVVVMTTGAAKDLSTTTLQSDVYAFIYGQEGLMGGIGLQGQKITRLHPDQR